MAFEDLIGGVDDAEDIDAPDDIVSPDLIQSRAERKGLPTDVGARARTIDFGADDEVIGPAPVRTRKAAPAVSFGDDDEVIGSAPVKNPPLPKARPADAPGLIQPTQPIPPVQGLEGAPFRAPGSGMSTNMLTGDEAYKEHQDNIAGAEAGVAEARARLDAAEQRDRETSGAARRRGTSSDQQRLVIEAELETARQNLADAESGLSAAKRSAPPTQTPLRDAASRFATAVGTIVPDVVGGLARPLDAGLDAVGVKGGTGAAEAMRKASEKIALANQPDYTREEDFTAKIGQGAGSAVGFVATGAIGKAAGLPAWAASGVAGAAQNAEQYYREADNLGAPAYKKALAYIAGGAIGSTEAVGLGRIADELDKTTGGGVKRYFGLIAKEMGEEGLQEGVQQLLDNIAKYGLFGKDPGDITKDVATNALIGAMLGMGMAGTLGLPGLVGGSRRAEANVPVPPQVPVTPEDIAAQVLGESSVPPVNPQSSGRNGASQPAEEITPQPSNTNALPTETPAEEINPAPTPEQGQAAADGDRAMLRAYGYDDQNIDDMGPAQIAAEVAAAEEAGIEPEFGQDDTPAGSRAAPVEVKTPEDVKAVAAAASADYTPAQGEANNRPLGHGKWNGLPISMEVAKGGVRKMVNPKTKEPVEVTHAGAAYGYFKGTVGADGMHVDLYMGENPESDKVFVIDEIDRDTGKFRQSKVMGGFNTEAEARAAYVGTSSKGEDTIGGIGETTAAGLKDWLKNGNTRKPFLKTKAVAPAKPTKSSEPMSLMQFIASRGGLAPHPELSAIGITGSKRVQVPGKKGFFGVVRPTGDSLDMMREALEEAGYLRGEINKTSTVRDLLDAMDAEERGQRKAAEGEEGTPTKGETQRLDEENANRDAIEADNRAEIEQMLRDAGMPDGITNEADIALAARIMVDEGLGPDEALDRAALRNVDQYNSEDVTTDDLDDTFGFGAIDAVQPRPVQEDERPAAAESSGAQRPGEESRPDEPVDDVPRAGEDREGSGQGEAAEATERAEQAKDEGPAADQGVTPALSGAGVSFDGKRPVQTEAIKALYPEWKRLKARLDIGDITDAELNRLDVLNKKILGRANDDATTERTEAGEQTVLPGAEKIGDGEQAQRAADKPLKPKVAQKPADDGLFGDEKDQTDLLDVKPQEPKSEPDLDFDSIIDEALDQYAPEKPKEPSKPRAPSRGKATPRGAGRAAKSAAKNVGMGLADVAKGLDALFSPKNKLGAGPSFDEETYAKAKPLFMSGVAHFAEAGRDVRQMLNELVKYLIQTAKMDRATVHEMRDYLKQFASDVQSGAIDLNAEQADNEQPTESADERTGTDGTGPQALDETPAEQGSGVEGERGTERGPARSGEPGADGDRPSQEPGLPGARGEGGGAEAVHPAAGRGKGRRAGARTRRDGSQLPEERGSAAGDGRRGPERVTEAASLPAVNYRITDETELGQGSETVKFRDNIAAIETLKTIERENRRATADEQRTLARYVGWGGLANAFRDTEGNLKPDWQARGEALEGLLTKEELMAARRSTRNAHYTSRTVVDAMWGAAKHLGFKGGLSLELSAGTGNFLGLVPEDVAGNTRFLAVEFDSLTARIAKALYPQDTVLHSGLHKVPLPDGEAVLNIGNPPFGSESLRFQYKPELAGLSIHNQFFLAGLDALRPGGLQIMVVSRYLLDAQESRSREMIAAKAKLLGAIRLPDTAFKENARTEVVTDILFLQRLTAAEEAEMKAIFEGARQPGKGAAAESARKDAAEQIPSWTKTATVADPLGGEDMVVSSYFASNPRMVMGKLERSGTMRTKEEVNVTLPKGTDLGAMLNKAIQSLPRDVLDLHQEVMDATLKRHQSMGESLAIALAGHEIGHVQREDGKLVHVSERETPAGGFEPIKRTITADTPWSRDLVMDADGKYYVLDAKVDAKGAKVKEGKRNVYERKYFEGNVVPSGMRLGQARLEKLGGLVTLRDLVKRQLVLESEDAAADEMEGNRKKLAKAYQSYTASNGLLNDPANVRLLNDLPDGALVAALEIGYRAAITNAKAARTGEKAKPASATPAPIMSRRVVPKYEPATKADTPQDALSITLSETGHADMDRIARLLGLSREEAIEKLTVGETPLLYKDPETGGFETRNGYLSGNVARKLKAAQAADLAVNVKALQEVQPERWGAENVSVIMGSAWVPPKVYEDFVTHLLGVPARVNFSQITNSFNLFVNDYGNDKIDQWGMNEAPPDAIVRNMLNSRVTKVMDYDSDGKAHVNQEKTALAALKQKEIENEFSDWVFRDADRRNLLVDIFNEKFNTRVNRQHDGTHLTLPGKVPDEVIQLRRHQKNAVWRGIYERFMLLDHVVGAGKTFTAIARAMERRRMGLSRKPMIAVPNHLVEQWTADVYRLYPAAKVLAAGSNQFDKKNRRRLFAKIATGDWDIVIVPHSSFGFIGIAPETETRFLEEELRIARTALKEAEESASQLGGRGKPFTVKQAEALVTKLETKLDGLKKQGRDNMLTFEQMGVDDLTIDEAHEFKNLFYSSSLTNVKGMGDKGGSQKAFDLYNKVRVLRDTPTGTVTFMTGTPISNSAVEMYNMMRYLAAQDLADLGLEHFDAWRTQSVSASAAFEPTESGSGLKEVTRLGRSWSNMRALMELYYSFTDSVSQDDINKWYAEDNNGARFPVPKVKDGGRKEVIVKPTPAQRAVLTQIVSDFNSLPSISDPEERNKERLKLMDRARKVSLDVRAAEPYSQSKEEGGKLDQIADNVARIYKATTADAATQLVFIDRSVKSSKGDNKRIKAYDDLLARRDAAMEAGNERQYREIVEALEAYDANEMESLKAAQRGGWNAYDQLKSNLIARGIPADQIRFVQEANNDEERKALFAAVNDGEVRVLIGSTPKMGAGTNVQERLVALHHGDVTWKPSDIEQREGRIIRQGNKLLDKYGADNFEVEILAYATENTIDAKMWDLNSTKLKMINGIRKYDGSFNMEFEDADAVGMAEIAALASGDPLLLERVKLVSQIDKLELLERAHRRKMFGVEDTISDLETAQKNYPARIEAGLVKAGQIRNAVAEMKRNATGRSVTIEGKVYSNRLEASNALEAGIEAQKAGDEHAKWALNIDGQRVTNKDTAYARINDVIGDQLVTEATIYGVVHRARSMISSTLAQEATKLLNSATRDPDKMVHIGQMLGYRLNLGVFPGSHTLSLTLSDGDVTMVDVEQPYSRDTKIFAVQTTRALFDKLEGEIEYESEFTGKRLQAKIDEAKARLPSLREERGKPFAKAEELKSLRDRLGEVITTLDQRAKDAEGNRGRAENPEEEQASLKRIGGDPGQAQPITPEARAKIEDALTAVIRKIAGTSVEVRFVDSYELGKPVQGWGSLGEGVQTAAGSYLPAEGLITIALADPAYPLAQVLDTTFHEAFHSLEDRLLTDQEMEVLKREDARLRQLVQREFRLTDEQVSGLAGYEVRAMAFEHYAGQRARGLSPIGIHIGIRRAFERLMDLFQRVGNMLRGLGYQNAEDILGKAFEGAYASRGGTTSQQGEQFNIRPEVRPQGNLNRFESYDPLPENWRDWWKRPDLNWRDRVWGMIDAALLKTNRSLGDRYVDMRRMQAAVELAGRRVNEGINMALAATLFEGRTEKRLKDYWLKTWKPVLAEIAELGIIRGELHEYLYARHAPERNAHIADINPAMPDGGSGMTNDEAQGVMERFAAQGKREALERAAQKIDAIVRRIRSTMVADQLEHEETIRGWEQAYQYYVPLQGFEAGDEDMAGPIQRSSGFDVRGPETKAALGRSSKADDILSNLFLMGERTIIRGEQNRVGRTAMRFMQSNPQPSLYDVQRTERILTDGRTETTTENDIDLLLGERPVTVQRRNPHTGLVESVTRVASHFAKDSFAVKVGGHTYYVRIKHPGLLTALKSVGIERLPKFFRMHGWLTRQFAAFRTARNPDWFVANLSRDIQDAAFTLNAEQRAELLKHFAANIGTLRSYIGAVMGEMMEADNVAGGYARTHFADRKWAALYEDWKKNGGQIAFMGIHDLDEAKREIEAAFNETKEGYLKKAAMLGPRTAKNMLKAIEFFNAAIEAGTRLAVYDAALKAGMTKAKAAELSKEATTNFNRKGIHSAYLGSVYAFFNARVQGAVKIPRLLRNSRAARRAAIGLVLAGYSTTLWNLAVSPDDEDKQPEYMKRKYWEREKFFIFYMPGSKEPTKIPMGYGLQLFWMLGENLAMLSQGKIKPGEAAANYLSTLFNAFSPISSQGSAMDPMTWLRTIMPSIEMPLLELSTNENWLRKPIHPKFGQKGEPHSEQPFTTTSPYAIDVAQFLNKATGGDAFRPGAVDLYPGTVQYMWQFITGGLGQTADRTATMIKNWEAGVPTPANQIPIIRHFVGANVEQSTGEKYYEDREAVQTGMGQVRKAIKADPSGANADAAASTIEEGAAKYGARAGKKAGTVTSDAEKVFRETDKELKALRGWEKVVRNDAALDRKARETAIKGIRERMREVQERARKAYREISRPSGP
ncbi:MAG: LPD38 domain-containing protein [Hyphomicrobium sp.]|jgi:N12 class adenine-specific DNA methylase